MKSTELPTLPFESKKKWADRLAEQHDKSTGVWLIFQVREYNG